MHEELTADAKANDAHSPTAGAAAKAGQRSACNKKHAECHTIVSLLFCDLLSDRLCAAFTLSPPVSASRLWTPLLRFEHSILVFARLQTKRLKLERLFEWIDVTGTKEALES